MKHHGIRLFSVAIVALAATGVATAPAVGQELTLTSSAFEHDGTIPLRNSAYGDNVSPALSWSGAPAGTQSFALILEDPDVPMPSPFVHWVIYNIPGDATGLPEGIPTDAEVANPAGARQGPTGLRRVGYFGPRPPAGPAHNYNFRLFALSRPPNLPADLNKEALLEAIDGDVLAETTLTGMYQAE